MMHRIISFSRIEAGTLTLAVQERILVDFDGCSEFFLGASGWELAPKRLNHWVAGVSRDGGNPRASILLTSCLVLMSNSGPRTNHKMLRCTLYYGLKCSCSTDGNYHILMFAMKNILVRNEFPNLIQAI